ncbi:MAG: hypothetical protein HOP07_15365 [Bacteriovoracaceae bacterium]|nr:hypothetical protein [Bacteriovoracaceae bacterium]
MKRFYRRFKKEAFTRLVSILPEALREKIIRSKVKLDYNPPEGLRFKLAETKEELEQAFRLLYRSYVAAGSMKPNTSEMRITPYHALPSTSVLIAVLDGKVIATISVFRMGPFGIPASKVFNVKSLLESGVRFAEISSLTLDEEYRNDNREIIFGILKYLYEYTTKYFGIEMKLIVIKPFRRYFYESLLLFKSLENKVVKNYSFSNGATVIAEFLDLKSQKARYKEIYSSYPDEKNLYKYFCEKEIANFEFPERPFNMISDPVMTPELMSYFFCEKTTIIRDMTDGERKILQSLYPENKYKFVLNNKNKNKNEAAEEFRPEVRVETNCLSRIVLLDSSTSISPLGVDMQIRNISYQGLMGFTDAPLALNQRFRATIEIGKRQLSELEITVCWQSGFGHYGFRINKSDEAWNQLVTYSISTLLKDHSA